MTLSTTKITSISEVVYDDEVFDIEVEDNHNYFCDDHLVHNCNKMVLEGLFGTVRKFVSTKDLINSGTVANFDVTAIVMKHGDQIKKEFHQNLAKLQGGAKKYSAER